MRIRSITKCRGHVPRNAYLLGWLVGLGGDVAFLAYVWFSYGQSILDKINGESLT